MNKVILIGRLTKNPEIKYTTGENPLCVARYSLAVNRKYRKAGRPNVDFISCSALGSNGEFAGKYLSKGVLIGVVGELQVNSYKSKDGVTKYDVRVIVDEHHFAESKKKDADSGDGFVDITIEGNDDLQF